VTDARIHRVRGALATDLVVEERGPDTGEAVVLIHGFPFSRRMWEPQLSALAPRRRLVAPDLRGSGDSGTGDGQYTMELLVDDLFSVLDAVVDGPVVACGLSMGGYVLLRALEREPDRFRAAVLCDTRSAADSDEGRIGRAAGARSVRESGLAPFVEGLLEKVLSPTTRRERPEVAGFLREIALANPPVGVVGQLLAMAGRTDTTGGLGEIRVPTLVVVGEEDALTPPETARELAERISDARLVSIPGAGHMSNVERPAEFDVALESFLEAIAD
jgi:pimeloyl-ACP methyl ester carboxylesterase